MYLGKSTIKKIENKSGQNPLEAAYLDVRYIMDLIFIISKCSKYCQIKFQKKNNQKELANLIIDLKFSKKIIRNFIY